MPPTRSWSGDKRVLQACQNCRRKKSRCPGERPTCSMCSRLGQHCEYTTRTTRASHEKQPAVVEPRANSLELRLAELEGKMKLILDDRQSARPEQPTGDEAGTDADIPSPSTTNGNWNGYAGPTYSLPPEDTILEAIDLYFKHCHRQPLWLFQDKSCLISGTRSEEVVLLVLALASCHAGDRLFEGCDLTLDSCCDISRMLILLRMTNRTVTISTIQATCLLAFVAFVMADIRLCRWYLDMAKSLIRYSRIDAKTVINDTSMPQERQRLFWSVFYLDQLCGSSISLPTIRNINDPSFSVIATSSLESSYPCLAVPFEAYSETDLPAPGVWAHLVQLGSLWQDIRNYVSCHANYDVEVPWALNSDYNRINSYLLDIETTLSDSLRFPNARFSERSPEEVQAKFQHWLPWMAMQLTYHTYHAILNHPFLRTASKSKSRFGQNVFWKTSAEKAFFHGTWISQFIRMCIERKLETSDPFLAHSAAVAATLHLYYCEASDDRIRVSATTNLSICRSFIGRLAAYWPICRAVEKNVDRLIALSQNSRVASPASTSRTVLNTTSMWRILDFLSCSAALPEKFRGFLDPSLCLAATVDVDDNNETTVEDFVTPLTIQYTTSIEDQTHAADGISALDSMNESVNDASFVASSTNTTSQIAEPKNIDHGWSFEPMHLTEDSAIMNTRDQSFPYWYQQSDTASLWWDSMNL